MTTSLGTESPVPEPLSPTWSELVSKLGHELRTPLASAQMLGDLLGGDLPPQRRQRYAQQLAQVLGEQRRLLTEVVELTKISAGRLLPETRVATGTDLVQATGGVVRELARATGVTASVAAAPDHLSLTTDPEWVLAIARAMAESALAAGATTIEVDVEVQPNDLCLHLTDNGEGAPEEPAELLRPFCRHRRTTTPGGSASLRLASAYWRARALGGELSIAASPADPAGLIVTLRLPL